VEVLRLLKNLGSLLIISAIPFKYVHLVKESPHSQGRVFFARILGGGKLPNKFIILLSNERATRIEIC
jgi:hypothetical protein